MVTTIGLVSVSKGDLSPLGRSCVVTIWTGEHAERAAVQMNPDEVRALIDALTPYARRRKPWRARLRTL